MKTLVTVIDKWLLPYHYKYFGIGLTVAGFFFWLQAGLTYQFFLEKLAIDTHWVPLDETWLTFLYRIGIVGGQVIVALSQEKEEDEMVKNTKIKLLAEMFAYTIWFVLFINLMDCVLSLFTPSEPFFKAIGLYNVHWPVVIYLLYYNYSFSGILKTQNTKQW